MWFAEISSPMHCILTQNLFPLFFPVNNSLFFEMSNNMEDLERFNIEISVIHGVSSISEKRC